MPVDMARTASTDASEQTEEQIDAAIRALTQQILDESGRRKRRALLQQLGELERQKERARVAAGLSGTRKGVPNKRRAEDWQDDNLQSLLRALGLSEEHVHNRLPRSECSQITLDISHEFRAWLTYIGSAVGLSAPQLGRLVLLSLAKQSSLPQHADKSLHEKPPKPLR